MPDYRGGGREMSRHGAELVKAIREGRTERQRQRNLGQKIMFGAVQAALTGAGGVVSAGVSKQNELDAKREAAARAASAPLPDYVAKPGGTGVAPSWLHEGGVAGPVGDRTELAVDNDVTASLRKDPGPYEAGSMTDRASAALAAQSMNQSRELAPIATWYTPAAREKEDREAGAIANDMRTAEQGIRAGGRGMMGSQ